MQATRPERTAGTGYQLAMRSQQEDGIRSLSVYGQALISLSCNHALYATNGTPEKFWAKRQEGFKILNPSNDSEENSYRNALQELKNKTLSTEQKNKLFEGKVQICPLLF